MTLLTLKSYQQAALDALAQQWRATDAPVAAWLVPREARIYSSWRAITWLGRSAALTFLQISRYLQENRLGNPVPIPKRRASTRINPHLPSDTIRSQTLNARQTSGHPYREALEGSYGAGVRACVLDDPVQADLNDSGEEFLCAQLPDNHRAVKHWVRNLTTAPYGIALATSKGRFYPDFVAELLDGRVAVVKYKGAHLLSDPYEIEKRHIGELWARKIAGKCLFGQIVKDQACVGMSGQLDTLLA